MRQIVVPQFIDIEPKIIGPIGPRQLIILIVTAGLIFLCYKLSSLIVFVVETLFICGLGGCFAFLKVNGRPFHYLILNLIQAYKLPHLRIWKKELIPVRMKKEKKVKEIEMGAKEISRRKLLGSRHLSEIALIVDTGGAYNPEEEE